MRKLTTLFLPMAMLAIGCNDGSKTTETTKDTTVVTTEAAPPKEEAPPMDSAAMMKAWMDYMTPGEMHKWMATTDGAWKGEMKSWNSPDAPPEISTVTATNKMVMGGRYQQQNYKGTMMGQPFEGTGWLAYDNSKKKFINNWIDNMGTGIMMMEGTMDEGTKTITLEGEMRDAATGKDNKIRQVLKFPDANTHTMEMYCEIKGKEQKMMEITMTRK